jgi:hypothetical protein
MWICGYLVIALGGLSFVLLILWAITWVINRIYYHMNVSYAFITFIQKRKQIEQYIKDNE